MEMSSPKGQVINKILLQLPVKPLIRFRCLFIDMHRSNMEIVSSHLRLFQIIYQLYPNEGLRSWCYVGSPGNIGCCQIQGFPGTSRHAPNYGFGFDSCGDHKLVKITYIDDKVRNEKKQYWSKLRCDCFPSQYYYVRGDAVFFNGCIHWLTQREYGKIRPRRLPIVSFDVVKEVFHEFWLPNPTEREANCISPLHGSLSVCAKSTSSVDTNVLNIEVWLMKEYAIEDTWTKLYVTRLDEELSGPIIPLRLLDYGAEAIVYINKNVFLYDHENEEFEDFGIWANGMGVPYVTSFIESLVWYEPNIVVESTTPIIEQKVAIIENVEIESKAKLESTMSKKDRKQDGNCVIL
ncbi:unnamed protein product [Withania somnifera]